MDVLIANSKTARLRGLFGRRGYKGVLLLDPCNDIHTFGMRSAIDVAFIAEDGKVLEVFRNVGPFHRIHCTRARATLERFARDEPWVEPGEHIALKRYVKENVACRAY